MDVRLLSILHSCIPLTSKFRKSWEILFSTNAPRSQISLPLFPAVPQIRFEVASSYHKYLYPDPPTTTTMMKDPCLAVTGEGIEYREFSCLYPALNHFYFRYVHFIPLSLQCRVSDLQWQQLQLRSAKCHLSTICLKHLGIQNVERKRRIGLKFFENNEIEWN
jgi:hypothetical protein